MNTILEARIYVCSECVLVLWEIKYIRGLSLSCGTEESVSLSKSKFGYGARFSVDLGPE